VSTFKPMLAADCKGDLSLIKLPCLASPKLDGVRCIIKYGVALSRSLKPIPNAYIQQWAQEFSPELEGLDGELIVGLPVEQPGEESVMSRTMSGVMRKDGTPDFTFYVFDDTGFHKYPFAGRLAGVEELYPGMRTVVVPHRMISTLEELKAAVEQYIAEGYEGIMTRDPNGLYKQGRSTVKEQGLIKVKLFQTDEAEVIGVEEQMHNENEKQGDGIQKRGTSAVGLVPAGVLGSITCRRPDGVVFGIGSGFTAAQRHKLWAERTTLPGRTVTYKHFAYGTKNAPRFPTFVSFRDKLDL